MRLKDRVVFITGASRGIGRTIALACAREGADIVVAAKTDVAENPRLPGTIHDVAREVEQLGRRALPIKLDVRDDEASRGAVAAAVERFGRVDALINNAGVNHFTPFEEQTFQQIDQALNLNIQVPLHLCLALLPHLRSRPAARIVNIGSVFGAIGYPGYVTYSATKFALRGFSEALRRELADTDVTVHYLAPRATRTRTSTSRVVSPPGLARVDGRRPRGIVRAPSARSRLPSISFRGVPSGLLPSPKPVIRCRTCTMPLMTQ